MSGRNQAIIMILLAVIIAAGFIILDQRDRINELSQIYDNTKFELDHLEAQYEHLYDSYQELDDQASSYRRRIIQLNQEIDKIKNYEPQWRELTVRYSELLLEVARLNGLLLMQETGNNITAPFVEPRKEEFHIGDTLAFHVESMYALYGSYFMVYYPNGTLCWEGDPLGEWVELDDYWVPPYCGQTAYMTPMILYEDYPLGNWTYIYWFGEIKMGEGWFIVHEAVDDYLGTGVSDLNESENAVDLAVSAFHEQLDNAYNITVTKSLKYQTEYPEGSGNVTDVWRIDVKGMGFDENGNLVWRAVIFHVFLETGEIWVGPIIGAGITDVSDIAQPNLVEGHGPAEEKPVAENSEKSDWGQTPKELGIAVLLVVIILFVLIQKVRN